MQGLLLKKNLRDLRSSLAQSIALVFILALGVASLIALSGAYRDLGTSYNRTYRELRFADVTFRVESAPASAAGKLRGIAGVKAVTGRLIVDGGLSVSNRQGAAEPIRARLIGIPAGHHPAVNDVLVTRGGYFTGPRAPAALLESHFAAAYGLGPGDTVHPIVNGRRVDLRVAGVAASPEYLIVSASKQDILPSARTFAVLFVPLPLLQELSGNAGAVNDLALLYEPGAERPAVLDRVEEELGPYGLTAVTPQEDQPSNAALRLDLEGYRELAFLMPALILLAAAASLYVMLGRQVRAQQVQIGLMKSLGYSRGAILGHYLALALMIGLAGSLAGLAAGQPLGGAVTSEYAAELGIPLVQTRFHGDLALSAAAVTVAIALLAGLFPARRASGLAPAIAMRPDPARALVRGGRSWLERVVPLSMWLRFPARNVFRVRSRSISTAVGVVFAFVLVLASWGMIDSMRYLLADTFRSVERWDLYASFARPLAPSVLERVRGWTGVRSVQPLLQFPATLRRAGAASGGRHSGEDVLLTAFDPSSRMHALRLQNGRTPAEALRDGRVVINRVLADKLDVRSGDRLTVATPLGEHTVRIGGVAEELMAAVAYISLDAAEQWVPLPGRLFNGLYMTADPARASALKSQLYHLRGARTVQLKSAVRAEWESLMGLFYVFMGVIFAFALAMAFALLFNAMTVNVLEQQREFATLRSIGMSGGRIAVLMTTENVLLWVLTLAPGLVLGTVVARQLGSAFESDLFSFTMVISPWSYLITALGILATMVLAALPAVRRVSRLNLAEATKVLT